MASFDRGGAAGRGGAARRVGGAATRLAVAASIAASVFAGATAISVSPAAAQSLRSVCNTREVDALLEREGRNPRTTAIDKGRFYSLIKSKFSIYNNAGRHYPGTDALLDYWNARPHLKDLRWLAYALGTSYHETARRMYPVRETLASTDAAVVRILSRHSSTARKTYWRKDRETGQHYYGRGYVQLTWKRNYEQADIRLGKTNLPRAQQYKWNAELALDPPESVEVLFDGMIYGWYTGKYCLPYYFDPEGKRRADWKNARRIVNILDRWQTIEGHSKKFLSALEGSVVPADSIVVEQPEDPTEEPQQPPAQQPDPEGPPEVPEELTAEQRLIAAEARIEELSQETERLSRSNGGLLQQIDRMAAAAKQTDAALEALRSESSDEKKQLADLAQELEARRTEVSVLTADKAALEQRVATLTQEVADLQRRLSEAGETGTVSTELVERNAALTRENEDLKANVARLESRAGDLQSTISQLETRNGALSDEMARVVAEQDGLRSDIEALRGDLDDSNTRLTMLNATNHQLNRENLQLENQLFAAQSELTELKKPQPGFWDSIWGSN